jgi:hypothetical protein
MNKESALQFTAPYADSEGRKYRTQADGEGMSELHAHQVALLNNKLQSLTNLLYLLGKDVTLSPQAHTHVCQMKAEIALLAQALRPPAARRNYRSLQPENPICCFNL